MAITGGHSTGQAGHTGDHNLIDAAIAGRTTPADVDAKIATQHTTDSSTFGRRNSDVLYPEAYGAVGDGVTDDTAAINAMVTAGNALATAGHGHVIFQFDAKTYLLAAAPTHPNGTGGAYAQIPLPTRVETDSRAIFEFKGTGTATLFPYMKPTVETAGTVFLSTASGGLDATYGLASVIGGPAWKANVVHSVGASPSNWSNITVVLDGVIIRRPNNPTIAGADFSYCLQAKTNNVVFDLAVPFSSITYPTHYMNIGLLMPEYDNNVVSTCNGETLIVGCYAALRHTEHFTCDHLMTAQNVLAIAVGAGYHPSIISHAGCEHNTYVLGEIDPATGLVHGAGNSHLKIGILEIEDATDGDTWANICHVNLMDGNLFVVADYTIGSPTHPNANITFNGTNTTYRLTNLGRPGNAGGAWTTYTPTLAGWSVGDGTITGSYLLEGKTLQWEIRFSPGSTSTFAGGPTIGLPMTVIDKWSPAHGWCVVAGDSFALSGYTNAGAAFPLYQGPNAYLSPTVPGTWAGSGCMLQLSGTCEIA